MPFLFSRTMRGFLEFHRICQFRLKIPHCTGRKLPTPELHVGTGAGSYEPLDREVPASNHLGPSAHSGLRISLLAVEGVAERLPHPDKHFDPSMATFTVHQRQSPRSGLTEIRRVIKGPITILTCAPRKVKTFWLSA
jgi:hypothetical protein